MFLNNYLKMDSLKFKNCNKGILLYQVTANFSLQFALYIFTTLKIISLILIFYSKT